MKISHYVTALALTVCLPPITYANSAMMRTPMEHAQNFQNDDDTSVEDSYKSNEDPRVDMLMNVVRVMITRMKNMSEEIQNLKHEKSSGIPPEGQTPADMIESDAAPAEPESTEDDNSNTSDPDATDHMSNTLIPETVQENPDLLNDDNTYSMIVVKRHIDVNGTHDTVIKEFEEESGAELKDYIKYSMVHQPDLVISEITEGGSHHEEAPADMIESDAAPAEPESIEDENSDISVSDATDHMSDTLTPESVQDNPDLLNDDSTYSMTVVKRHIDVNGTHDTVIKEFEEESGAELKDYIKYSMVHQPDLVISEITENEKAVRDPKEDSKSVMKSVLPMGSKSMEAPAKHMDTSPESENESWLDKLKDKFSDLTGADDETAAPAA